MNIKVMHWNIRHGQGIGGSYSLIRIAQLILTENPDIVGLNEVYQFPLFWDQPQKLADLTGMKYVFQRNVSFGPLGSYGNAILVKGRINSSGDIPLPKVQGFERRGLLLVSAEIGNERVYFGTTHLGLRKSDRISQISFLESKLSKYSPLIVTGDFNGPPAELRPLLVDHKLAGEYHTYPANKPRKQLDYVIYSKELKLTESKTVKSLASDHLPIISTFK